MSLDSTQLDYICPRCRKIHRVSRTTIGKAVRCSACQEIGRVGASEPPIAPPPVQVEARCLKGSNKVEKGKEYRAGRQPIKLFTVAAALGTGCVLLLLCVAGDWAVQKFRTLYSTAAALSPPSEPSPERLTYREKIEEALRGPPASDDEVRQALAKASGTGGESWRETAQSAAMTPEELFAYASPAVVLIQALDERGKTSGQGSGFFVSGDGLVLTNLHVVRGASSVVVSNSGSDKPVAGLVGFDESADAAIIKLGGGPFPFLRLAEADSAIGARAFAIGNPLGLEKSFSDGVVSGRREFGGITMIQTTAPISPGSSGGPLLASNGAVVGMTTGSLESGQNVNLAVPSSVLRPLLARRGTVRSLADVNRQVGSKQPRSATVVEEAGALPAVWSDLKADRFGEALKALNAISEKGRGGGYWSALGYAHFWLGNSEESTRAYARAVELDGSTENLIGLSLACRADGYRSRDSIAAARQAIAIAPGNADAYVALGIALMYSEKEKSCGAFRTAVELEPKHIGAHYNLALAYMHSDDYRSAISQFEYVLGLLPEHSEYRLCGFGEPTTAFSQNGSLRVLVLFGLGESRGHTGQHAEAVKCYQEILRLEENNGMAYSGLCHTYRGWRGNLADPDAKKYEVLAERYSGGRRIEVIFFANRAPVLLRK